MLAPALQCVSHLMLVVVSLVDLDDSRFATAAVTQDGLDNLQSDEHGLDAL